MRPNIERPYRGEPSGSNPRRRMTHKPGARSALGRRRSWLARSRAACARAWGPAAVRQGLQAKRAARPNIARGPWRRLPAPEHAQFSRAQLRRADSPPSILVASDMPRLAAKAARPLQSHEPSLARHRTRDDARLRERRQVETIGDAFVAERRSVQPADQRLNALCNGWPLGHCMAL